MLFLDDSASLATPTALWPLLYPTIVGYDFQGCNRDQKYLDCYNLLYVSPLL